MIFKAWFTSLRVFSQCSREKFFDFELDSFSISLFRYFIGTILIYETLFRFIYYKQFYGSESLSQPLLMQRWLHENNLDGWSHWSPILTDNWLYHAIFGMVFLVIIILFMKRILFPWTPLVLAYLWLGVLWQMSFVSYSADKIIFFALIASAFFPKDSKMNLKGIRGFAFLWQISLIFIFAGINKFNHFWMSGSGLELTLKHGDFSAVQGLIGKEISPVLKFSSYFIPFAETSFPIFLFFKRGRVWAAGLIVLFGTFVFIFFYSQTLALVIISLGVSVLPSSFWKKRNREYISASTNGAIVILIWFYCAVVLVSCIANLRQLENFRVCTEIRNWEKHSFLSQRWSFFSLSAAGPMQISVLRSPYEKSEVNWTVSELSHRFSKVPIFQRLMIHRTAIFFRFLFWYPNPEVYGMFGGWACKEIGLHSENIKIKLSVVESNFFRSYDYSCK